MANQSPKGSQPVKPPGQPHSQTSAIPKPQMPPMPCIATSGNNSYVQNNVKIFGATGMCVGAVIGAGVVLNIVGFPEAELAEGTAAVDLMFELATAEPGGSMAVGAIAGGLYGATAGGITGFTITSPQCP
jgi:hypothetical protein